MQTLQRHLVVILATVLAWWLGAASAFAQLAGEERDETGEAAGEELVEAADEIMDTWESIDDATPAIGWSSRGDFRTLFSYTDEDARDGSSFDDRVLTGRLRTEATWNLTPSLRASARLAGSCSTDDCNLEFVMDREITGTTLERGKITFDELFLHFFQSKRFNVAVGRLQTRLVTRAGVFAKSLDRADSDNAAINWTDGLHGTLQHRNGWESQLILQYNSSKGASNVRRFPLDFADSGSRITSVMAFENLQPWGPIVQREVDFNYLPSSLLKDGTRDGRVKDYWGFVGRLAAEWPIGGGHTRWRIAGEAGYAPETPTRAALGIAGPGDVGGVAWNVVASLLDFRPDHDIGINYGRIDPGWLLSPDFTDNEEQLEIRYRWKARDGLSLECRVRQRDDLVRLEGAERKRGRFDMFLRLTWRFSIKSL